MDISFLKFYRFTHVPDRCRTMAAKKTSFEKVHHQDWNQNSEHFVGAC